MVLVIYIGMDTFDLLSWFFYCLDPWPHLANIPITEHLGMLAQWVNPFWTNPRHHSGAILLCQWDAHTQPAPHSKLQYSAGTAFVISGQKNTHSNKFWAEGFDTVATLCQGRFTSLVRHKIATAEILSPGHLKSIAPPETQSLLN